jgi:DNA-binding NarL/FixJ family response regulator
MSALPDPKEKSRVVIVEDHPMFRERLAHLINKEADMIVCGEADNARDGLALIQRAKPSLAIVDITLKDSGGLDLLKDIRAHEIQLPILVLSMHDESLYAERALRAGAKGYITKHEASIKVMTAIRQVLAGEIYLDSRVTTHILRRVIGVKEGDAASPIDRLTDRELAVFELIGEGRTTREIGGRLHLGLTTVDTYRSRIKEKLNLENAAQLHVEASRWVQERESCASSV